MTQNHKTLTAIVLAGLALTTAAWAQFGGGPLVPPANIPLGGRPNLPISGANPFGRGRMPFATGTVSAVDAGAGTITLAPMFGGGAGQTVKVTSTSQITALTEAKVGDLKVGDKVQVRGVPTGITASQITAGESGDTPLGGGMTMPFGGMPIGAGPVGINGPQAASAQAMGKITSLNPLTISVSDSVQVILKAAPDVKVSRYVTEKIGDLKVGDHILASGQTGDDGVFTASRIRVNADAGMGRR